MLRQPVTALKPRRLPLTLHACAVFLLVALTAFTLYFRLRSLNTLPPWLWWNEANRGLDARELLQGHIRIFFPRALTSGPLYVYLTVPFVAAWDGQPFAVRLAGALLGTLQVPATYFLARALWRERPVAGVWAGLTAAGAWATCYWAQSINRMGFQANALPLTLTLAAMTWLNWTRHPDRRRALTFGLLAGLTLMTYEASLVTPLLWLALFLSLPSTTRRACKQSLPWALLAFALVTMPLLSYFLRQPGDAAALLSGLPVLYRAGGHGQVILLIRQASAVLGAFLGYAGDPASLYSIPNRLPFSLAVTGLFAGGLIAALSGLRWRRPRSWMLLLWWLLLCLPAVLSGDGNPQSPLLLAALPAAVLLASWPVGLAGDWLDRQAPDVTLTLALLVAVLLVVEGVSTGNDYFDAWPQKSDLYTAYQGDVWSLADRALSSPGNLAIIPVDDNGAAALDYAFAQAPLLHVKVSSESIESWLVAHLGRRGGSTITTAVWNEGPQVDADASRALPFYLAREGVAAGDEAQRGYHIFSYHLGPEPAFEAAGRQEKINASFADGLTLVGARWGAAYPNADRDSTVAAGGTSFWAILDWRADAQLKGKRVSLDLVDPAGHRLASGDSALLDAGQARFSEWQPGTAIRTYILSSVPATQPAGPVALEVRVYDAQSLEPLLPTNGTQRQSVVLAQATTTFASHAGALPDSMRALQSRVTTPIRWLGVDPWPTTVAPGQVIAVRLHWQLTASLAAPLPVVVSLGESSIAAAERVAAETPTMLPLTTHIDLRLPADLASGTYPLWLSTAGDAGSRIRLGDVTVSGRPRVFTVPALIQPAAYSFGNTIKLLGIDVPPEVTVCAGQRVAVTLVWQALKTPASDWVRFLHVLGPDGKPVAQVDSQPCGGDCPATSWLLDEVLVDRVELAIPADLPPGTYVLASGWYDPAAPGMSRLPATDAIGNRLPDDLVRLPASLLVR